MRNHHQHQHQHQHQHRALVAIFVVTIFCWTHALTVKKPISQYKQLLAPPSSSSWRQPSSLALSAKSSSLIEEEDGSINGDFHDDQILKQQDQHAGLLSPYHIIYPDSFANIPSPVQRQLPLEACLRLLRRTLQAIVEKKTKELPISSQQQSILRIEHTISHAVDPLCWLQAQTQKNNNNEYPSLYFATAEGTLETAVYGSVWTHNKRITTENEDAYWKMVQKLPSSAYLYGGQRFDVQSNSIIADEWKGFSEGFWVLPAVEIRRQRQSNNNAKTMTTTIAIHLIRDNDDDDTTTDYGDFSHSASKVLEILSTVTDAATPAVPPTTLPPVLSRASTYGPNLDGQEVYERGVTIALDEFEKPGTLLEKVVLARRMDLTFGRHAANNVNALDILRKWKFASKPGGHMFYIHPGGKESNAGEFFGCTPERLFQVQNNGRVLSEALAGTRPRGSTQEADEELSRQLFFSAKDQAEHRITGNFILAAFQEMEKRGWVDAEQQSDLTNGGNFSVRRLRHLQHICQRFQCILSDNGNNKAIDTIKYLLTSLHPTPAVGGFPKAEAMEFIRNHESFDRGFYSGPVGFIGKDSAEIVVAIRSGLVSRLPDNKSTVSVYAGAGIVPGSTVQGEWAETSYKLAVVSSIFPQSPITLQSAPSANAAWATAFIEELIRNGVTQFYICPGSRSTPLIAAIAKAVRSNVGVVHAMSIHDERGAGFRAVGYGRGAGHPAAVLTSSGTAISNLYPAIVEAGMDGVPLLVLTADRPYESRDTGANQAIDQVKAFSSSYVRWFRDILPPNDDVPVSVALADAAHAVGMSRQLRGPVHLNIQFRENLAPDGGPIRNDDRVGSTTNYDSLRFTDAPGFQRWSLGGAQWVKPFSDFEGGDSLWSSAVMDIGRLIMQSKRGVIVVGNLRKPTSDSEMQHVSQTVKLLSSFAQSIGFPILAGVQSGSLRFGSSAVVPFAEHLLRCPLIQENLEPDLVLQFGAPLVSTEIPKLIKMVMSQAPIHHVLVHPHHPHERADPEFTVSRKVNAEIGPFVKALTSFLDSRPGPRRSSDLTPLISLGRMLQSQMPSIVDLAVENMKEVDIEFQEMTEPEVVLSISKIISDVDAPELSLFISNSMPVRDAEAFLYSLSENVTDEAQNPALLDTGVNRGASGIDGIIASAAGFADSTHRPTTLLIGDVAALHDINSLHALRTGMSPKEAQAQKIHPLTIIVLNNDGGGIFSFLPIARHGSDVAFEEFFGTPTNTFSFEKGAAAFDLPFERVVNQESFRRIYSKAIASGESSIIEVVVAPRDKNVVAHKEITKRSNDFLATLVSDSAATISDTELLPVKHFSQESLRSIEPPSTEISKTLVLLHGWMGSKSEWDDVCASLVQSLPPEWSIIAIDLPGHGESQLRYSSDLQSVGDMLGLSNRENNNCASDLSIDQMASSVRRTLQEHGIESVDAIAGYSLGGRVALALKRMCMLSRASDNKTGSEVVTEETKFILVSAYPGEIPGASSISESTIQHANTKRLQKDDTLSREMMDISNRAYLMAQSSEEDSLLWSDFLHRWYSAPLWGSLNTSSYGSRKMIEKRIKSLSTRGKDFAAALMQCSPPRHRSDDWRGLVAEDTLFISGGLDQKYCSIGKEWATAAPGLNYHEIPKKGHALLVEAAAEVASVMNKFLRSEKMEKAQHRDAKKVPMPRNHASLATRDGLSPEVVNSESCPNMEDKAKEECDFDQSFWETIGSLDFEAFTIDLVDERTKNPGVFGSGWGANARESNVLSQRVGFIIQMLSKDGLRVGIGEVSPLPGLHPESLADAEKQLNIIASKISELEPETVPSFDATKILEMNGGMETYLVSLTKILGIEKLLPSIRSGIEMALISLASEVVRIPIHQALIENSPKEVNVSMVGSMLPLNGLITRGRAPTDVSFGNELNTNYESWKVKVGHQSAEDDAMAISYAFQIAQSANQAGDGQIRADANRGFNDTSAINFARALEEIDVNAIKRLEYVEEPLERRESIKGSGQWSLANQVDGLERWYKHTSISYALDESISDLAEIHAHDFYSMMRDLKTVFSTTRGCAAFVLKPSLLGLELSMRLARAAKQELGIGAVFTSSFDSGVGLSYAAFLGSLSDVSPAIEGVKQYPHGLSTFSMLTQDCLSPSFGSYVNQNGLLNVASLSRAFYGLGLDEIQSLCIAPLQTPELPDFEVSPVAGGDRKGQEMSRLISDEFEASTATSSSGREIVVVASLPLPFSADIACARFTDLPQQPRWSPWISSVAYLDAGSETEWTLRVRGVNFRWRATSSLLEEPYRGIQWESVSGLKNTGVVEFISTGETSSLMKVRMVIVTPRILSSLFSGTSVFFEDFLRNKILKWSLEMFRDVVKGDLALEEGNIELGDALFGAVEGKANAIEATLSSPIDD